LPLLRVFPGRPNSLFHCAAFPHFAHHMRALRQTQHVLKHALRQSRRFVA